MPLGLRGFQKGNTLHKRRKFSEEARYNMRMAQIGKKRPPFSKEHKMKLGLSKMKDKNPNWKGENVLIENGRQRARRWFGHKKLCSMCGNKKTEIHHKDGNTLNNSVKNLLWVCRRCHMIIDGRLEKLHPKKYEVKFA